jgi:hypothetical protein
LNLRQARPRAVRLITDGRLTIAASRSTIVISAASWRNPMYDDSAPYDNNSALSAHDLLSGSAADASTYVQTDLVSSRTSELRSSQKGGFC